MLDSVTGLTRKEFVCSLHCAVKSVTFSVYNNADLNFNIYYFVVTAIIAIALKIHYEMFDSSVIEMMCVLVYRRDKMSAGQNVQELGRKLKIQST